MLLAHHPALHDAFDWWSSVWIPASVGIASLLIAAAALISSRRAVKIANDSEKARRVDMVRSIAREDARLVARWVELKDMRGRVDRVESARFEAAIAMASSIVPGAAGLWELTEFETENRDSYLRGGQIPKRIAIRDRSQRTRQRIRSWAADPEGSVQQIDADLALKRADENSYLNPPAAT